MEEERVRVADVDKVGARRRPRGAGELSGRRRVPERDLLDAAGERGRVSHAARADRQNLGRRKRNAPDALVDHTLGERRLPLLVVNSSNVAKDLRASRASTRARRARRGEKVGAHLERPRLQAVGATCLSRRRAVVDVEHLEAVGREANVGHAACGACADDDDAARRTKGRSARVLATAAFDDARRPRAEEPYSDPAALLRRKKALSEATQQASPRPSGGWPRSSSPKLGDGRKRGRTRTLPLGGSRTWSRAAS